MPISPLSRATLERHFSHSWIRLDPSHHFIPLIVRRGRTGASGHGPDGDRTKDMCMYLYHLYHHSNYQAKIPPSDGPAANAHTKDSPHPLLARARPCCLHLNSCTCLAFFFRPSSSKREEKQHRRIIASQSLFQNSAQTNNYEAVSHLRNLRRRRGWPGRRGRRR